MLIAVDIGNTAIKLAWYDEPASDWPAPQGSVSLSTSDRATWPRIEELPTEKARWFVGSVHREAEAQLAKWVAHHRPGDAYRKLTHNDLPLVNRTDFPERVGMDRLLAAVAANQQRKANRPAIVIDAGTAVTVDVISADGAFAGGIIWPGWRMMAQTLADNTDALPLVTASLEEAPPAILGTSTEKAMRSGLFWGNVGAVREFLLRLRDEMPGEVDVFVTGGDAQRLAAYACPEARLTSELVLAGIVLTARALA